MGEERKERRRRVVVVVVVLTRGQETVGGRTSITGWGKESQYGERRRDSQGI